MKIEATFVSLSSRVYSDGEHAATVKFDADASVLPLALKAQAYLLGKEVKLVLRIGDKKYKSHGLLHDVSVGHEHDTRWTFTVSPKFAGQWLGETDRRTVNLTIKRRQ